MPSQPSDKAARAIELMNKGLATHVVAERLGLSRKRLEALRHQERSKAPA